MPTPEHRDAAPTAADRLRYELVLRAAGDLGRVHSAYHAELLVSTLLGSVYAVADGDRGAAVDRFAEGFRHWLAEQVDAGHASGGQVDGGQASGGAAGLLAVLEVLAASPSVSRPTSAPAATPGAAPTSAGWARLLGTATVTGAWAYGDEYGDQVTYLATFEYPDEDLGGPEHAVAVLVDRNLDLVKDLFVAAPAAEVVEGLRAGVASDDGGSYLAEIPPASLRGAVDPYLSATEARPEVPEDGSFGADRYLVAARLRSLPVPGEEPAPDGHAVPDGAPGDAAPDVDPVAEFRASAESGRLVGAPGDAPSLAFCLDLIERYAAARIDRDPLRWSPAAAERFLLDWVPRRAILDATDRALLPRVLGAWVRWAGRTRGLRPRAVASTVAAIAHAGARFAERSGDETLRSPQTRAVAQMLADGVDPDDRAAVAAWIERYNAAGEP